MTWFTVHAIFWFEFKQGPQADYHLWECMYLIRAESNDEARRRGEIRALQDEGDSNGSLTLNDRPARLRFSSIRMVVECQDLDPDSGLPTDGTELSYSDLSAANREEFAKLIAGGSASVVIHGIATEAL